MSFVDLMRRGFVKVSPDAPNKTRAFFTLTCAQELAVERGDNEVSIKDIRTAARIVAGRQR
jgi:hypothetical protein